jgi:hypothetical protein
VNRNVTVRVGKGRAEAVSLLSELARSEPAAARALHPQWQRAAPAAPGIGVWIAPQAALQILHTAHAEPSSLRELFLRQLVLAACLCEDGRLGIGVIR